MATTGGAWRAERGSLGTPEANVPGPGSLPRPVGEKAPRRSPWQWFDRYLGKGTYHWLRERLDPQIQYSQFVYAEILKELVAADTRWLDAGCGHRILEARLHPDEEDMVSRAALAVGCDLVAGSVRRHRSLRNLAVCCLDRLAFQDGSFNLATLNMVAEHLERPAVWRQERAERRLARDVDRGLAVRGAERDVPHLPERVRARALAKSLNAALYRLE